MSTDIGTLARRYRMRIGTFEQRESNEETLTKGPSWSLWRRNPEEALEGNGLFSVEAAGRIYSTRPELKKSFAIVSLASTDPQRFLSLVSKLSPLLQDILIQYYLLGRTYSQIGALLFPEKQTANAQEIAVKNRHRVAILALGAVLQGKRPKPFKERRGVTRRRTAKDLGDFVIAPNGQLGELFAPSWGIFNRAGA